MQYTADLVHKHQVHAPHPDIIKAAGLENPNFPSGTIAMEWETSAYRVVQWAERIGGLENMYVAPSPTKKQPFIANLGQNTAMFKTSSQQQDAAWQVMRWLTSTEPAAHYAAVTFFLPPRKSVLTTPEYAQNLKDVPQFKTFVDALDYGYRPFHPEFPEIYGTFQKPGIAAELEGAALGEGRPGRGGPRHQRQARRFPAANRIIAALAGKRARAYATGFILVACCVVWLSAISYQPVRESSGGGH